MSLSSTLKPLFKTGDRNRGASYFRSGQVRETKLVNGHFLADVAGSYRNYEVSIDFNRQDDLEDTLSCTCPRYEGGFHCKHIWATILTYEAFHKNREVSSGAGAKKSKPKKKKATSRRSNRNSQPHWEQLLLNVALKTTYGKDEPESPLQRAAKQQSEVHYVIDTSEHSPYDSSKIFLTVYSRSRKTNGQWRKPKALNLSHDSASELADPIDRQIAGLLMGADRTYSDPYAYSTARSSFSKFEVEASWPRELCELLVASGRLRWTLGMDLPPEEFYPVEAVDFAGPAAEICIHLKEQTKPKHSAVLEARIESDGQRIDDDEIVMVSENGAALLVDRLIRVSNPESIRMWTEIKNSPPIVITKRDRASFLQQLAYVPGLPAVQLPDDWAVEQPETLQPTGLLKLFSTDKPNELGGEVYFRYGDTELSLDDRQTGIFDQTNNRWSTRSFVTESELTQQLTKFPIADTARRQYSPYDFHINKKHLLSIVDELAAAGWTIQLQGKPIKHAGTFDVSIESAVDWFDLSATVNFDGQTIALPSLLQAIAKKENFITLADGSQGRIPSAMLEKYSRLATFGQIEDDKIRFRPTQAMLLDAMLDAKEVKFDKGFSSFRKKLKSFKGVKPKSPPRSFKGELRSYQRDGLGWLHFLREFGLGGCLADDMGLGKTIQVLSLLEARRTRKLAAKKPDATEKPASKAKTKQAKQKQQKPALIVAAQSLKRKPSIVVVPKSLIFNWIEEAAKFTPRLRILNYTGTDRQEKARQTVDNDGFDVLLTTYGTMRKDIEDLSQIDFDYAILDESQAIKNSKAQCAKSSRLLRADHRLAMTGTPIENHLGELWSLFEFLNPGMLGNSSNFARLTNQKKSNEEERDQTLASLSKAISPFLLRRTKEQVLSDLPPKTEQILYCDMLPAQQKAYNELKEYYRVKLAKKVETDGIGRSKIQVLEALLRLRQVACDPRLLDKKSKPGAKLELFGQQAAEIISEGHKVLVFSQFTSFLSLAKEQLDELGIKYEYLDGKSTKRAQSVKRFQEDESVSAFLISIKAGGHGLNLTAADYVFILDPWWNPAVEAQAIDRAHRMGQQNSVIAYRMICRDTVEEKIVSLQASKRDLADKIIRSDESLIRTLTAEDLQVLFD